MFRLACLSIRDPELARVGLTESQAGERGLAYRVTSLPFDSAWRAWTISERRGFMKTLVDASNEPIDPSDPAIVVTPNGSGGFVVQLEADRLGSGAGRIYTLTATAADSAGNVATSTATCTVPHDQGK